MTPVEWVVVWVLVAGPILGLLLYVELDVRRRRRRQERRGGYVDHTGRREW